MVELKTAYFVDFDRQNDRNIWNRDWDGDRGWGISKILQVIRFHFARLRLQSCCTLSLNMDMLSPMMRWSKKFNSNCSHFYLIPKIDEMMSIADLDGDGKMRLSEFCKLMEQLVPIINERPRRKVGSLSLGMTSQNIESANDPGDGRIIFWEI